MDGPDFDSWLCLLCHKLDWEEAGGIEGVLAERQLAGRGGLFLALGLGRSWRSSTSSGNFQREGRDLYDTDAYFW